MFKNVPLLFSNTPTWFFCTEVFCAGGAGGSHVIKDAARHFCFRHRTNICHRKWKIMTTHRGHLPFVCISLSNHLTLKTKMFPWLEWKTRSVYWFFCIRSKWRMIIFFPRKFSLFNFYFSGERLGLQTCGWLSLKKVYRTCGKQIQSQEASLLLFVCGNEQNQTLQTKSCRSVPRAGYCAPKNLTERMNWWVAN